MRVITGFAKGRRLEQLQGNDVRPTTERVKEAVFSIIQFNIEGRAFLDLFAGSGQMGIEALSRGAARAVFCDSAKESIDIVKRNLKTTKLEEHAAVFRTDSLGYLQTTREKFDLVFMDPPYGTGVLQQCLQCVERVMNKSGIVICESPQNEELPESLGEFVRLREYRHGKIKITTYCHSDYAE